MGTGIALYFSLFDEPSPASTLIPFILAVLLAIFARNHPIPRFIALALLSITLGFATTQVRTNLLSTPFIGTKIENVLLTGRLVHQEDQPHRRRLTLDSLIFSKNDFPLHKVRLTCSLAQPLDASLGDYLSLRADLLALSDPVSLQGYDFRRQAFFQGIGATGRIKEFIKIKHNPEKKSLIDRARMKLTREIRHRLPGQTGEIAVALITGERSGIAPPIRQAFIDAGLAHILAISGLHLSLVAGLIFLLLRRSLVLIPSIAEKYPVKKWSAGLVIVATLAYLAISGYGIPGQRAFIMIGIVMLGIILDRDPVSLRLVAIAATLILFMQPESLLSPSFQLSFAAVTGLIAAYESGWPFFREWAIKGSYFRKIIVYIVGLACTTLIASLATMPYSIAIFNRFTLQTLTGNFIAIPLTSLVIMPSALVSVFSLSFGGWNFAFDLLSLGLKYLIDIAEIVSSLPGATLVVATPPSSFTALITFGGLWLCLWKSSWRWYGFMPVIMGIIMLFYPDPADVYIGGDASVIAYRQGHILYVSDMGRGAFYTEQWLREVGLKQKKEWPANPVIIGSVFLMKPDAVSKPSSRSSMSSKPVWFSRKIMEEASKEKIVVTTGYARKKFRRIGHILPILIDRSVLKEKGTYQIWIRDREVLIKAVRESLGNRPWNPRQSKLEVKSVMPLEPSGKRSSHGLTSRG